MPRDYDAALTESFSEAFGNCPGDWPESAASSIPFLAIVFRFLEAECEDDDEVEEFLRAAITAHQNAGPCGFPPVDFATRLAVALPAWWCEPSDRSPSRYAAWEAAAAVHRITDRDTRGDFSSAIKAALSAYALIQEDRERANVEAFTIRMRASRERRVPAAT
ncbi:hypothetical protein ACFYZ8_34355 [Streptomyces sp. NPDC001668]|uniref:hypothetical protein n=1 Tax=Streptomyces sp. NPDC001668 TaxID=3364598 RepID=UPI003677D126